MKKKIAVCGPRKESEKGLEGAIHIAEALASLEQDMEVANGGTVGFPVEVARVLKTIKPEIEVVGYVPLKDEEEWKMYEEKGIAPFYLYDRIVYSTDEGGIKLRALGRIPRLIGGSDAVVAHAIPKPGNTHVEILNSSSLEIPTFVLTDNKEDSYKLNEVYQTLARNPINVYSDVDELNFDLKEVLKC